MQHAVSSSSVFKLCDAMAFAKYVYKIIRLWVLKCNVTILLFFFSLLALMYETICSNFTYQ